MKAAKTIYIIAIVLITVLVVFFFGGRRFREIRGIFNGGDIVKDSVKLEPFSEIELNADVADLRIEEGDEYRVDYEYPSNISVKGNVDHDVLKIKVEGKKSKNVFPFVFSKRGVETVDTKLKVIVPKGTEIKKADFVIKAGSVNLSDRVIDELKADCEAGSLNLYNITSNKVEVEADAGNIEVDKCTMEDCDFRTSAGRIYIDSSVMKDINSHTDMGEIFIDSVTFEKGEISSSMGTITIDGDYKELKSETNMGSLSVNCDNLDSAKLDLSVDMGSLTVNGDGKGKSYKQN